MTIEDKDSILRRIQKLLAIAGDDRADPNEAAAAAGMAEKVMRKYQIDHADLIMNRLKQGNDLSTEDVVASAKTNGTKVLEVPPWAGWIAVAVAKFNECSASTITKANGEKAVRFYGFTEDVKLASWTFNYLVATTNRLVKAYKATDDYAFGGRSTLNSYRKGVAVGIVSALKKLTAEKARATQEDSTGTALMVAKAQAIAEVYGHHPTRTSKTGVTRSSHAYANGFQAGKAVDVGRRAVTNNQPNVKLIGA